MRTIFNRERLNAALLWVDSLIQKSCALAHLLWSDICRYPAGATEPQKISVEVYRWSVLIVSTALGGLFLANTFLDPIPRTYRPDFGKAQWIQVQKEPIVVGYFHRVIEVAPPLGNAWISVAAPDTYSLYINGKLVDSPLFVGKSVARTYDIRPFLIPGKNVIAIDNERSMYPGTAQIIVRGEWKDIHRNHEILSDAKWKSSVLSQDRPGKTFWNKATELSEEWKPAIPMGAPGVFDCIETVTTDPEVLRKERQGVWIAPREVGFRDVVFRGNFKRWWPASQVWTRLFASGTFYDLKVNGHLVADRVSIASQTDVREIGRFCRLGNNEIEVRVRAERGVPTLCLDGWTQSPFGGSVWKSSESWKCLITGTTRAEPVQILGFYGQSPWGFSSIAANTMPPPSMPGQDLDHIFNWGLSFLIVLMALYFRWKAVDAKISLPPFSIQTPEERTSAIACLHLPCILMMCFGWMLSFDARLSRDWCFQPWFWLVTVAVWEISYRWFLEPARFERVTATLIRYWNSSFGNKMRELFSFTPRKIFYLGGSIVALGFLIRFLGMTTVSMDHDEVQQINFSHSVLRYGVPFWQAGSFTKFCSTYELLSYVLAFSRLIFGLNDFAYRLPSVLLGTASIFLTGLLGYRFSGWKTGLLAATVYAFFPASIGWSQNAFYPSLVQFFTILTVWIFYESMRSEPFHPRLMILAAVLFIFTYFSWEASAFLLFAIPSGFLALHGLRFFWLRDWTFLRALYVVGIIIFVQLLYRKMTMVKYLGIGVSLNDITTPSAVFLSPMDYDAWFYLRSCFFQENFLVPTLLVLLFPFLLRDRGLRYLGVVTLVLFLCYTNLLKVYSFRYTYLYQPFLLVLASAWVVRLCTYLRRLVANAGISFRWIGVPAVALVVLIFLLCTNGSILKLYDASYTPETPSEKCRMGFYKIDYRGASEFVKKYFRPNDTVVAAATHVFKYYNGITPEYTINTLTSSRILYDGNTGDPRYMDVFLGATVIRSAQEFDMIRTKKGPLWLVAAPYAVFVGSNSVEMINYINQFAQVVYESYQIKVFYFPGPPGTKVE